LTEYMGGGFGSKFSVDRWGVECAQMARDARAPVKLMLERDAELTVAGDRPSTFAEVEVAADADGNLTAWSSRSWGSGGLGGAGSPPLPYVFQVPNRKHVHSSVVTNIASSRAWRAPNHPQACLVTMAALEDLAAALEMDPLDFFNKNLELTGPRAETYREEFEIAADLMDWKRRWKPRGQSGQGPVRQGLGLSLHTWGGQGHQSNCELVVHPDGSVRVRTASQDLGTGTKTVIAVVAAETFGLPVDRVKVQIGDSSFPPSGASGGSTTVGGVSAAVRRAAQTALKQLKEKAAEELEVPADELEAADSRIFLKSNPQRGLSWEQAAGLLGVAPLTISGANPGPGRLTDSGAGGVQMADVSVDIETGVVKLNKMVAVQDCGLVVDLLTAKSQVYGGLIMGIASALTEEKIIDPVSGRMLNAEMEFYKLPGIGDVGELVVHMMQGEGYDERGVIGLGEPPVISPGAAISNAVANAIGVRVPYLPLTAERVLEAIEKGGVA
jgi:xanthine dehydrogenase YagR molybdenum-binding subunit